MCVWAVCACVRYELGGWVGCNIMFLHNVNGFRAAVCTFLATWPWRGRSEQNSEKTTPFHYSLILSSLHVFLSLLLYLAIAALLIPLSSLSSFTFLSPTILCPLCWIVPRFRLTFKRRCLLLQSVKSIVRCKHCCHSCTYISIFILNTMQACRFCGTVNESPSKCFILIAKLLHYNPAEPPSLKQYHSSCFLFFNSLKVSQLPKRGRVCVFSLSWCMRVRDRGKICLGQLSHRKHSSVRRRRFLSSCAKPLPTPLCQQWSSHFRFPVMFAATLALDDLGGTQVNWRIVYSLK